MKRIAVVVCVLGLSLMVQADVLPVGTWVHRDPAPGAPLTMTVEAVGNGRKLTYKFGPDAPVRVMVILTQLDGKDAPVLADGQPMGHTMGIRTIDSRHTFAVLKIKGQEYGTSKSEVSADGRVLKVEMMATSAGNGEVLMVEYWDKK